MRLIGWRLALLLCGLSGALWLRHEAQSEPIDVLPIPGPGEYVNLPLHLTAGGTFFVELQLPTVGDPVGLAEEAPLPCELLFTVKKDDGVVRAEDVKTIQRLGQFGWAHTDLYRAGGKFVLAPGDYRGTLQSRGSCKAAQERGGAFTLEQDVEEPTA